MASSTACSSSGSFRCTAVAFHGPGACRPASLEGLGCLRNFYTQSCCPSVPSSSSGPPLLTPVRLTKQTMSSYTGHRRHWTAQSNSERFGAQSETFRTSMLTAPAQDLPMGAGRSNDRLRLDRLAGSFAIGPCLRMQAWQTTRDSSTLVAMMLLFRLTVRRRDERCIARAIICCWTRCQRA